jgi:hypothetical protein
MFDTPKIMTPLAGRQPHVKCYMAWNARRIGAVHPHSRAAWYLGVGVGSSGALAVEQRAGEAAPPRPSCQRQRLGAVVLRHWRWCRGRVAGCYGAGAGAEQCTWRRARHACSNATPSAAGWRPAAQPAPRAPQ